MTQGQRPTLNPQILLMVFIGVAALGQLGAEFLESRRAALAQGRQAYLTALTSTRTQLSGLTRRLMADQAIKQNLVWNLSHSVSAALSGKLQKGGLDQAWVIDEGCQELGRAAIDHPAPFLCPWKDGKDADGATVAAPLANGRTGFFWRMAGDHPALGVVAAFPEGAQGEKRFAVTHVVLDDDWLALYPAFKAMALGTGLSYRRPATDGTLLATEGLTLGGAALAPLTSSGLFDKALLGRLAAPSPVRNPLFWPTLLAGLAVAALTYSRDKQRTRALARREHGLVERCRELLTAPSASCLDTEAAPPPIGAGSAALPAAAETLLLAAWREKNRQLDLTRARVEELGRELQLKEAEAQRLSLRLAESAELDSLATQMARTTDGFLAKASGLADEAENLTDILGGPIAEQSKLLFNVMMDWQEGVATRGARKFIRSLAETEGSRPGVTLLDEQIVALAMMAGEVSDLAVNASIKSHRLVESAAALARVAGLWRGLASLHESGETARASGEGTLGEALESALALVHLDKRHQGLTLISKLDERELAAMPPVRDGALVTALYHVLLALSDGTDGQATRIGLRLRQERDRIMLVAQLAPEPSKARDARGSRMPHHLEIARAVLSPFGVSISALPALDGPFPIALSWPRAQAQIAGAPAPTLLPEATT